MRFKFFSILLLLSLFIPSSLSAQGDFDIKAIRPAIKENGHFLAQIKVVVGEDHLIYREQTSITSESDKIEIVWPDTRIKPDPFTGKKVEVFDAGSHIFKILVFSENLSKETIKLKFSYQGCSNKTCFFPTSKTLNFSVKNEPTTNQPTDTSNSPFQISTPGLMSLNLESDKEPEAETEKTKKKTSFKHHKKITVNNAAKVEEESFDTGFDQMSSVLKEHGIFWVLILSFLGGLLISLTPCVYPMIPITLSIIGSRKENQSFYKGLGLSAIYVAGLSLTYALLGLTAATFGAQIRSILQGTAFQAAISVIFFLLALSMFDIFMIQAPTSLRNKLSNIKKTGLFGIFIMGLVSGLMASPCVAAPLAGILAFIAATGSQTMGFFMLLLFAWGMSIPLLLIGAFSGSLNALPKAGEWMNRVKEFYGFLLMGASLYFARPLIGETWTDLGVALLLAAFAAFLGLFNKLEQNSTFLQKSFKAFGIVTIAVASAFAISATARWGSLCMPGPANERLQQSQTISWNYDLDSALKEAAGKDQLIFVDFRADWCTICRELEERVFPRPAIANLLNKMVAVKIDATTTSHEIKHLNQKYSVVGLPTLLILDSQGNEIKRMVGNISTPDLKSILEKALR
ncbi:MAG: protein-disulfide reductase DsbD [Candidatus Rifleibacteriota bacterium]